MAAPLMLIRNTEYEGGARGDVRVASGKVVELGHLDAADGEEVIDADGGLILPGLHDHHIHVAALAASLASLRCGPPDVADRDGLEAALRRPGNGWLRGIGYHESVAGMLDRTTLDGIVPDRPVRIQHRSGRMWFFNSAGLERLLAAGALPLGLDRATGRLFDEDAWLKQALRGTPPCFAAVGRMLARAGVTGLTDMSPANDAFIARHFTEQQREGALPQKVLLAGRLDLSPADEAPGLALGPAKLHLHEAELPPPDDCVRFMERAHAAGRAVAVHCATEVELVYALSAFEEAGTVAGDRIEHASVAPDTAVAEIARLGLAVVSQPHFIAERGDAYLRDVEAEAQPLLYRLRAFRDAGVPLAAGSDAPFGQADPWASIAAAVSRRTADGQAVGAAEALTPEEALDLYLRDPTALTRRRRVAVGAPADLCLLDCGWRRLREDLSARHVRASWVDGRRIHDRVDQPPF